MAAYDAAATTANGNAPGFPLKARENDRRGKGVRYQDWLRGNLFDEGTD